MMSDPALTRSETQAGLIASGPWTAAQSVLLERLVVTLPPVDARQKDIAINVSRIEHLDTLGAWLLERVVRRYQLQDLQPALVGVPERFRGLLEKVHDVNRRPPLSQPERNKLAAALERIGRATAGLYIDFGYFLAMLGAIGASLAGALLRPRSLRATSAVYHLYRVGWQAVPIVLLITFLIGGIIAQQGIFHFRKFGADAYVVDMVGILVLREIGVLIVAIMVAGRSGSAYTAELGSMKMREEIDALRTMGRDPVNILVLPRVIALVCALPILTFLGSMAALYGGGLVAWIYGGMSPDIFIARLREAVSVTHFEVGIIKAPFMALVIGTVACSEGFRVKGSAESLGLQTTTSVVKSIFLVIVLDGLFAVFFASIGM
ncbi:MAG TPA: MlaE family lipid ABC transporter permease subunit [Pseudolabrys sp.]|nr:MlaE family lipid ABC transporter permease subunit [Pseudolabrys sp.]